MKKTWEVKGCKIFVTQGRFFDLKSGNPETMTNTADASKKSDFEAMKKLLEMGRAAKENTDKLWNGFKTIILEIVYLKKIGYFYIYYFYVRS